MAELFQDDPALLELFGDEYAAQQQARRMGQQELDALLKDFGAVFDTKAGKKVLWWILEQTHPYQVSFTGNSMTYFREGERQVGLKVLNMLLAARPTGLHDLVVFRRNQEIEE